MENCMYKKMNFHMLVNSKEVGSFLEVSMSDLEVEPIEYRSEIYQTRKIPCITKQSIITLKKGTITEEFMTWIKASQVGHSEHKTVIIELYDETNRIAAKWEIMDVLPIKYEVSDLQTINNGFSIDKIELSCQGLKKLN